MPASSPIALPIEVQSDEANYLYLALGLERFGIYFDYTGTCGPGYAWLIHFVIGDGSAFDLTTFRALQVAASSVIGITTMLFAWRLFSSRAAVVAGPPERAPAPGRLHPPPLERDLLPGGLPLPALWHVLVALDRSADGAEAARIDASSSSPAFFLGGALHLKEMPLFLLVPLTPCWWRGARLRWGPR